MLQFFEHTSKFVSSFNDTDLSISDLVDERLQANREYLQYLDIWKINSVENKKLYQSQVAL